MTFIAKYGRFDEIPPFEPPRGRDLTDLSPELNNRVIEDLTDPCHESLFVDRREEAEESWADPGAAG